MDAQTIGSLLPLALLLAVLAFVFWWARRKARIAPPQQELRGPYGWLALFILASYVFAPFLTLGNLANEFSAAEKQYPNLLAMPSWRNYKTGNWVLFGAIVVWQWWVAYNLHKRFVTGSVTIAKTFLLASPVVAAIGVAIVAYTTLNYVATEEALTVFFKGILGGLVWFLYFTFSKRVKRTYLTRIDGTQAVALVRTADVAEGREDPTFSEPAELPHAPAPPAPAPKAAEGAAASQPWAAAAARAPTSMPVAMPENTAYSNVLVVQLDALKRMHERGALSDDEYGRKRQELLARI